MPRPAVRSRSRRMGLRDGLLNRSSEEIAADLHAEKTMTSIFMSSANSDRLLVDVNARDDRSLDFTVAQFADAHESTTLDILDVRKLRDTLSHWLDEKESRDTLTVECAAP